jgi:hypothetical protein
MWHARQRGALPMPEDFVERIENQHYRVIISNNSLFETEPALKQLLHTYYVPTEFLGQDEAPPTSTGMIVRPELVYRPK